MTSRNGQRGAVLIEVMVSTAVFTVGILGMAGMQIAASGSDARAARYDRATQVARELFTYLEALPYEHALLTDSADGLTDTDLLDEAGNFQSADPLEYDSGEAELRPFDAARGCVGADCFRGAFAPDASVGCADAAAAGRNCLDYNDDDRAELVRYVRVVDLPPKPGEAAAAGKALSVIVRWRDSSTGRYLRTVVFGYRYNPSVVLSGVF